MYLLCINLQGEFQGHAILNVKYLEMVQDAAMVD